MRTRIRLAATALALTAPLTLAACAGGETGDSGDSGTQVEQEDGGDEDDEDD